MLFKIQSGIDIAKSGYSYVLYGHSYKISILKV